MPSMGSISYFVCRTDAIYRLPQKSIEQVLFYRSCGIKMAFHNPVCPFHDVVKGLTNESYNSGCKGKLKRRNRSFVPEFKVGVNKNRFEITASIPGVIPESIKIESDPLRNSIKITGNIREINDNYHILESISIPGGIHSQATANINSKVLTITLPKIESQSNKIALDMNKQSKL